MQEDLNNDNRWPSIIMFIEQPPELVRKLYPGAVWRVDPNEKVVYPTFDDESVLGVTPWAPGLLDEYDIRATFFTAGDNIRKCPDESQVVIKRGYCTDSHTYNHLGGSEYNFKDYMANTEKVNEVM